MSYKETLNLQPLPEEVYDKIWQDVWNSASNDDTDEDLCQEHTRLCVEYTNNLNK